MFKITIDEQKKYEVIVGRDIHDQQIKKTTASYKNVVFFIDSKVQIKNNEKNKYVIEIDEKMKNLDTYQNLFDSLLKQEIPRISTVFVAIGGGVLLDIIGFLAATYKRGVDVLYVPTTLLSQVDVAIGSKNGLNVGSNKNMIGTFYSPIKSIVDTSFLQTQDQRNFNNGIAEIIKYGCIKDKTIIDDLEKKELNIEQIIYKSLVCKKYFVEKDPFDNGIRKILNFGHTYGHAIEGYYNYEKYLHGEAVSIGMNLKFNNRRLQAVCQKFKLPITIEKEVLKKLDDYMKNDKKVTNYNDLFIKIKDFGEYELGE